MKNHKISFEKKTLFSMELRKRVNDYFKFKGISEKGNHVLFIKTGILFLLAGLHYYMIVIAPFTVSWVRLCLCLSFGVNIAFIGFNVMHDGNHGSYSNRKWVNYLMGLSLNLVGGNNFLWKFKHNVGHHTYTNIDEMDDDIDAKPVMRFHLNDPLYWYHKYQYIYWPVLYSFNYLFWIIFDFKKYFTGKIGKRIIPKMSLLDHIVFWFSKFVYGILFIAIPIHNLGFISWLVGFIVLLLTCGLLIATVFQLAHMVIGTSFPLPNENSQMENEWMIHQLETTANFSPKNRIVSWCVGGLNFQVEHHLFPKVSHVHYSRISDIVKKTCHEFGVRYVSYPTLKSAISAHMYFLYAMGRASY